MFPNMDLPQLTSLLDSVAERAGSEWFEPEHRLEVSLTHHDSTEDLIQALEDEGSFSPPELDALRQLSDELSGAWVEVRVSGRGDHQAEMLGLVERLLVEGGCAFDDHSGKPWSLEQIQQGRSTGQTLRA